jgi:hypothetical protein
MNGDGLRFRKDGGDCSTHRLKALLHFKLLKPYSRAQTIFGQNARAHNEGQWEAPGFWRLSGFSVTADPSEKYNFSLLDDSG